MHLPHLCRWPFLCFTAPKAQEPETFKTPLLAKTSLNKSHLSYQPSTSFPGKSTSLAAWVALEKKLSPQSGAKEAARRIQAVQRGDTKELNLKSLGLHSSPPLAGCTNLEIYDLSKNHLRQISDDWGNLPNLQWIILDGNLLRKIPSFEQCAKLQYVGISFNPIRHVPASLRKKRHVWVRANDTLLTFEDWWCYLAARREKRLRDFLTSACPRLVRLLPPVDRFAPDYPANWHRI